MILRSSRKVDLIIAELRDAYAARGPEPDIASLIRAYGELDTDALCDLVEADVRERIERKFPVTLNRYLGAGLRGSPDDEFIDTVLDLAMQARVASGQTVAQAADALLLERPDLRSHVEDARALSDALSLSALGATRRTGTSRAATPPQELGAAQPDGQARYEVLSPIGKGAFGQVFRALDRALSQEGHRAEVAIKVLDIVDGASLVEASRARRVRHPSVVRVYDHGVTSDGRSFIVYELVEGQTLRERIERSGPLPTREAVALMISVIEGVHAAHGVQVLHRDLNPGNILIEKSGAPRVTDFGAAVGMDALPDEPMKSRPLGAPGFIAPEQWRGEGTESVQTDVFGLGALLFYALTGKCPNGATIEEARAFLEDSADRARLRDAAADLPRDLRLIVLRALAPDPAERHRSAAQLAEDLSAWMESRPIAWTHPGVVRRTRMLLKRRPIASAVSVMGAVIVFTSIAFASHWLGRITQQRRDGSAWRSSMQSAIGKLKQENQIAAIAGATIVMETLAPDTILRTFMDPDSTTATRIAAYGRLTELSQENLGAADPRTRIWRAADAMTRLSESKERDDTLAFVQEVRDEWKATLPPDSMWVKELNAWVDCARTKEIFHQCYRRRDMTSVEAQELAQIARRLEGFLPELDGWLKSSPTRSIVLRTLGHIYGETLLNQPDDAARIKAVRETAEELPVRPVGVVELL